MDTKILETVSLSKELPVPRQILEGLSLTRKRLQELSADDFMESKLQQPSVYLLSQPGKLIRPGLLLSSASVLGQKPEDFVDLAAGIELLHTASLIHDDILDKDSRRRGDDALHIKFGSGKAILAGDALIAKAILLASGYGATVVKSASDAAMAMCAGEMLDHDAQLEKVVPELDTYLRIARLKTATLIAVSTSVVADYAGSKLKQKLYDIGMNIGMSFQIKDDIMNFLGVAERAAKSVHSDIQNWRPNIISVFSSHGKPDPLKTAIKLNNFYLDQAAELIDELENDSMFSGYVKFLQIDP